MEGFLDPDTIDRLLNIGGSTGMRAAEFAEKYRVRATVLDPSESELEVAQAKGLQTVCGFIEDYQTEQ